MEKNRSALSIPSSCIGGLASQHQTLGVPFSDHHCPAEIQSKKGNVGYEVCYQVRNQI